MNVNRAVPPARGRDAKPLKPLSDGESVSLTSSTPKAPRFHPLARSLRTVLVAGLASGLVPACRQYPEPQVTGDAKSGRQIFRDDTFGNEKFWTDTMRMHEIVARE